MHGAATAHGLRPSPSFLICVIPNDGSVMKCLNLGVVVTDVVGQSELLCQPPPPLSKLKSFGDDVFRQMMHGMDRNNMISMCHTPSQVTFSPTIGDGDTGYNNGIVLVS